MTGLEILEQHEPSQEWAELRALLWPETSAGEHRAEQLDVLGSADAAVFLVWRGSRAVGFAEVTVRPAPAELALAELAPGELAPGELAPGELAPAELALAELAPAELAHARLGYLEGIFVRKEERRGGLGRRLVERARAWAGSRGCTRFASDTEAENGASRSFHAALGFSEIDAGELVFFEWTS